MNEEKMATKEEWDSYSKLVIPQLKSMGYLDEQIVEGRSLIGTIFMILGIVLFIVIILGVGFLGYMTYEGKFQSFLNSTNICEQQVCDLKCSEIPDCNPSLSCNVTFPSNLNIYLKNST